MASALNAVEQRNAAGMAAALKRGGEEGLDHGRSQLGAREARADGHHVGVVVLAAELRLERVGAVRAADTLDLVRRDGDADTGRADDDAVLALPACHGTRGSLAEDRIVAALGGVGAAVLDLVAQPLQLLFDVFLPGVSAVVTDQCDLHNFSPFIGQIL